MSTTSTIGPAEAFELTGLIAPAAGRVASRILAKNNGGSMTIFAFAAGQGLPEHTAAFDAFVVVLDGRLALTIGGTPITAAAGTIVRLPANVLHAVNALEPSRMLLTLLRETRPS